MGVGYYRDVTQWSKGDYNLANNKEDDLAVMQNYGITYRADDHGDSISAATPLSGPAPNVAGKIERSTDLDVKLTLYNSSGGMISPSYTYTSTGAFIATLTVTDDRGGQSSATVTIVVSQNPNNVIFVGAINMSLAVSADGNTAQAEVIIVDASGALRPGATVTGMTNSQGRVVLSSKKSNKKGNFIFTVTNVSVSGYTYDASRNVRTGNSIANR